MIVRLLGWHECCSLQVPEDEVMMGTILVVLLVMLLLGVLPGWGYSANWGYFPSGALGTILIVVIVLAVMGRL
jgi:hypothetical protein